MKVCLLAIIVFLPLTAWAQDPEVRELQQEEYFREFSDQIYEEVLDRLELEQARSSEKDESKDSKEDEAKSETEPTEDSPAAASGGSDEVMEETLDLLEGKPEATP